MIEKVDIWLTDSSGISYQVNISVDQTLITWAEYGKDPEWPVPYT
jgi:hypothetical protein